MAFIINAWDHIVSTIFGYVALLTISIVLILFALITLALCPFFELYHLVCRTPHSRSTSGQNMRDIETKALEEVAEMCDATYKVQRKLRPITFNSSSGKLSTISVYLHDVQFKSKEFTSIIENEDGKMLAADKSKIMKEVKGGDSITTPNLDSLKRGQPIVLMHGMMCGPTYFRPNIKALLVQGYDVHCICLPGFCTADANLKHDPQLIDLSKEDLLLFYMQFLVEYFSYIFPTDTTSKKPILFGHSFGGFLTSNMAIKHPELVAGVIISNVAGMFPFLCPRGIYWAWMFKTGLPNRYGRQFGYALNSLMYFLTRKADPKTKCVGLYDILQMTCAENFSDLLIAKYIDIHMFSSIWNLPFIADLIGVKIPLAQISSDDDDIIPLYQAQVLEELGRTYTFKEKSSNKVNDENFERNYRLYPVTGCWHHPIRAANFNEVLKECLENMLHFQIYGKKSDKNLANTNDNNSGKRSIVLIDQSNRNVIKDLLVKYGYGYFSKRQTTDQNRVALSNVFDALHLMKVDKIESSTDGKTTRGIDTKSFDLTK